MEGFMQDIEGMEFLTVEELYEKREFIREKYKILGKNEQRVYKWYFFYQLCIVDYEFKSTMWDYVCEIAGSDLEINHQFRLFKEKKERYHLKYILEEQKKRDLL